MLKTTSIFPEAKCKKRNLSYFFSYLFPKLIQMKNSDTGNIKTPLRVLTCTLIQRVPVFARIALAPSFSEKSYFFFGAGFSAGDAAGAAPSIEPLLCSETKLSSLPSAVKDNLSDAPENIPIPVVSSAAPLRLIV